MHCKCVHGTGRRARTRAGAFLSHSARADAHHHLICSTAKKRPSGVRLCATPCRRWLPRRGLPRRARARGNDLPAALVVAGGATAPGASYLFKKRPIVSPGNDRRLWPPQKHLSKPAPRDRRGRCMPSSPLAAHAHWGAIRRSVDESKSARLAEHGPRPGCMRFGARQPGTPRFQPRRRHRPPPSPPSRARHPRAAPTTLWMQTSVEYRMVCESIYRAAGAASLRDSQTRRGPPPSSRPGDATALPPAVILDLDETVLDNSRFEGEQALRRQPYAKALWSEWVALRKAELVPERRRSSPRLARAASRCTSSPTGRPPRRRHRGQPARTRRRQLARERAVPR